MGESTVSQDPGRYDSLKLENQLCFPLYACARQVVRRYTPVLKDLDLSYTQYITLLVLWEDRCVSVKTLGERLYLDSGTLTPVLKSLEAKGLVERSRCRDDERVLLVCPSETGWQLREKALAIPRSLVSCLPLGAEESGALCRLLWKLLEAEN